MRTVKKPVFPVSKKPEDTLSVDTPRPSKVRLTVVSEEEREKYRIPVYDYIL